MELGQLPRCKAESTLTLCWACAVLEATGDAAPRESLCPLQELHPIASAIAMAARTLTAIRRVQVLHCRRKNHVKARVFSLSKCGIRVHLVHEGHVDRT